MEIYIILFFIALLAIAATQVIIIIQLFTHKKQSDNSVIRCEDKTSHYDFPFHRLSGRRLTISPSGLLVIALDHVRDAGLNNEDAVEYINTFFSIYMKRNNLYIANDDNKWILLFKEREELPENL